MKYLHNDSEDLKNRYFFEGLNTLDSLSYFDSDNLLKKIIDDWIVKYSTDEGHTEEIWKAYDRIKNK